MARDTTFVQARRSSSALTIALTACRACMAVDTATFAMAAIATIAVEMLADPDGQYGAWRVAIGGLWVFLALVSRMAISRLRAKTPPSLGKHTEAIHCSLGTPSHVAAPLLSKWWVAALATVTILPLVIEPLLRSILGEGRPLEIQMVLGLRNLALGLAALSLWPNCARLSAAVSLCLMLFAHVIDEGSNSTWLFVPFALAGGVWLLVSYQATFANLVTAVGETKRCPIQKRRRIPWRGAIYTIAAVASLVGIWCVGPRVPLASLGEWVGTSGGTGANDPYARGGVNDGQEEVGGENPETTGFAETDKFLDSDQPTLYDAASDMYGEPMRRKQKQQERMISVTPSDVREIKNHAQSHRASREFAAARRSPKKPRKRPEDRSARALFEVYGRTPLHLRMDVLATYDGATWKPLGSEPCPNVIEQVGHGSRMLLFSKREADCYGASETHKLKIATITGSLAPTPTLLSRFRVGLVDRPEFFEWRRDGVLGFRGRTTIPSGTTIETSCRTANLQALAGEHLAIPSTGGLPTYREVPKESETALATIASAWADHHPRGPAQVAAIVERLRKDFEHDSQIGIAIEDGDPVIEFLTSKKKGPDYLFASAAVLLLREQGYSARLALGYYAAPSAFDSWTRHTPVRKEDLHFWPEILLSDGNWLALEPTPGYDVLLPQPTLFDRALNAIIAIATLAVENPWTIAAIVVAAFIFFAFRRELSDAVYVSRIRLFRSQNWRSRVLASLRLMESRATATQQRRAAHQTLANWISQFASIESEDTLHALCSLAQAAAYGPKVNGLEVEAICRRAEQTWTLKRFRRAASKARETKAPTDTKLTLSTLAIASS